MWYIWIVQGAGCPKYQKCVVFFKRYKKWVVTLHMNMGSFFLLKKMIKYN